MTYARGRRIVDADSHLMEWPDFLADHADPAFRDRDAAVIGGGRSGLDARRRAPRAPSERGRARRRSATSCAQRGPKWHAALGAVDPGERGHGAGPARLRAPGRVLVAVRAAVRDRRPRPPLRAPTAPTTGRWPSSAPPTPACSASASCDLDDLDRGRWPSSTPRSTSACGEIWIPARAPGGRAPGHVDHDPFWARLAERGVPFVLHVGSGPLPHRRRVDGQRPPARRGDDGRRDHRLQGLHGRVPAGRAVRVGARARRRAGAPPGPARRRDRDGRRLGAGDAARASITRCRSGSAPSPASATFDRRPSEQAAAQLRFTPYPFEDVGVARARESDPALYLFSSDYPHAEGGRDPLGRFDRSLAGADAATIATRSTSPTPRPGWRSPEGPSLRWPRSRQSSGSMGFGPRGSPDMKSRAAVLWGTDQDWKVQEIDVDDAQAGRGPRALEGRRPVPQRRAPRHRRHGAVAPRCSS